MSQNHLRRLTSMHLSKPANQVIALAGLIALGFLYFSSAPDPSDVFDGIVTEELIQSNRAHDIPLSFSTDTSKDTRTYSADFQFERAHIECHAFVTITIASAGQLLDSEQREKHLLEIRQTDLEQPPELRWESSIFPDIGMHAMASFVLGPGGGGDSLVFTTSDGRFDIEVEQGNQLSEGVEGPGVSCEKIAKRISDLYDKQDNLPSQ